MLTIRVEQMNSLARAQDEAFVDTLVPFVQSAFPDQCRLLGADETEALAARGARRAKTLGMLTAADTRRFVAMSFALGEGFETRTENAWARGVERQEGVASQRMDKAYAAAIEAAPASVAEALRQASADDGQRQSGMRRHDTVLPCGQKTWIEVQLVGMTGKPLPYERYRLDLPNGESAEGYLDEEGVGGAELIDAAACRVTFPDLDQHAVSRATDVRLTEATSATVSASA
jgi:hypothetical protein